MRVSPIHCQPLSQKNAKQSFGQGKLGVSGYNVIEMLRGLPGEQQKQAVNAFKSSLGYANIDISKASANYEKALRIIGLDAEIAKKCAMTDSLFGRFLDHYLFNIHLN